MKNKFLLTATLVAALTLATPLVANAAEAEGGSWKSNSVGWWYEYKDGKYVTNDFLTDKDGKRYYFDANGYMATGWQCISNEIEGNTDPHWYYFNNSGAMVTGWQKIDGKWYWFDDSKNEDGTRAPWNGVMAQGGIATVDDKEQVFAPSGQWVSGWTYDSYTDPVYGGTDADWYYANADGTPYDADKEDYEIGSWLKSNGAWYYIYTYEGQIGRMAHGIPVYDDEKEYYVGSNGAMITGWYQNGTGVGNWMYYNADGTPYGQPNPETHKYDKSWLKYNGAWYYIENGTMKTGWLKDENENNLYYLGADGKMVTGWYDKSYQSGVSNEEGTGWVYCNADGTAYTGWVKSGDKWYYIDNGDMVANASRKDVNQKQPIQEDYKKADGTYDEVAYKKADAAYWRAYNAAPTYIFDATGAMVTGWYNVKSTRSGQTTSDVWYYADADGKGHNGWLSYKGAWYYIEDGWMMTNCYTPDGYWVGMDGVWR